MSEVKDDAKSKNRQVLFQTDEFEIVAIEWSREGVRSEVHNHGWSQCLVLVQEGVFENHLNLGAKTEIQVLEPGQVVSTPVGAKHEMRCKTAAGKTLHVYTPKIKELEESGLFHASAPESLQSEVRLAEPVGIGALKKLLLKLEERSIATHSPYFMNQLFSGVWPQMLLATEFMAKTRTTLATYEASPVHSSLEAEVVRALCAKIGWESGHSGGVSVPGGSGANFMAVHCARQKLAPELKKTGLKHHSFKVFVSSEAHYSFKKACVVLGLGLDALVPVPTDELGKMKVQELDRLVDESRREKHTPLLVVATAGTTVLGAFDPIAEIAAVCKRHGLWLHVDGAWGGPALFSKKMSALVRGIELADSMTFDAHKLFGAALTSSFFLARQSEILLEANDVSGGDYLFHADDPTFDRGRLSWQCGRGADAVGFWTTWKNLGDEGLGEFVDRLVGIREEALTWIKGQSRLQLISPPDYLNVCVRVSPPATVTSGEWSKVVRDQLKERNLAFVNFSANADGPFLRLILAHPYLTFAHVQQILLWALSVS